MTAIDGRHVVITAGAAGIGLAMAKAFAAEGCALAVCDVDRAAISAFKQAYPAAIAHVADVTDEASLAPFFADIDASWPRIDVICCNAGTGGPAGPVETLALSDWKACLAVNLDGAFLTARFAAERMKRQGGGVILMTSSTAGLFGYPMRSPYATAKWGIIGLMKTLAMELGPDGIRVNAICPGAVEGDRMDRVIANEAKAHGEDEAAARQRYVSGVSMRSWVTAEEIADAAVFLASSQASKISGLAFPVDGNTESLRG